MEKLEAGTDLRNGKQMMDADRHREDQQQQERDAAHFVAVQRPASSLRQQDIERDVGRDEPEVDDGVQGPGKQHPSKARIDRRRPAEGIGQDQKDDLRSGPQRGPAQSSAPAVVANIASGTGRRGWSRFQRLKCETMSPTQIHEPITAIRMPT